MNAAVDDAASLSRRALLPWLVKRSRRPLPCSSAPEVPVNAQELHADATRSQCKDILEGLRAGYISPKTAVSAHFLLARQSGRQMEAQVASALWDDLSAAGGLQQLGGRDICDLLHVLSATRGFASHANVAGTLAAAIFTDAAAWDQEFRMWPMMLPILADYFAKHAADACVVAGFLDRVLAPFWVANPGLVDGSLAPHHAAAVSAACERSGRAVSMSTLETVRATLAAWSDTHIARLGPRGLANVSLSLSRVAASCEVMPHASLSAVMLRAGALLDAPGARSFRPDWLGMLVSALARSRCRVEVDIILRLLAAHVGTGGAGSLLAPREVQNVALVAHAAVKLDIHALPMHARCTRRTVLQALGPAVWAACESDALNGSKGARSAGLLAHAYGAALAVPQPRRPMAGEYVYTLRRVLAATVQPSMLPMKIRFQLLSSVQCWWFFAGGPCASLGLLRQVHSLLTCSGRGPLPGPTESAEGQAWITTRDHEEILESLPDGMRSAAESEHFVFPFWMDILVGPGALRTEIAGRDALHRLEV